MNAIRWMDRFGVDQPTAGDIAERSSGRSRLWALRQVVSAIVLATVRDVRSRPRQVVLALPSWLGRRPAVLHDGRPPRLGDLQQDG
jgi:hypothetical protein